ncbi:MAG: hypothetical protein JWM19_4963 [Actinomycetia bacterium]|nr:hypothetical protein [Actinomycetes bacterium]
MGGHRFAANLVILPHGVFRADYTGTTLRDHLGLSPLGPSAG